MALYNTAILTSNTKLESGSGDRAITTIIICNTTSGTRELTLHAVQNNGSGAAGTISDATQIVHSLIVPAGDTVSFDQEKMVLTTGDDIWAVSTGTGLSATVSTLAV